MSSSPTGTGRSPRRSRSACWCCWWDRSRCSSASRPRAWRAQNDEPQIMARARFAFTVLCFAYAFLYLPIALVIVYSFNASRLVTVWAGFSLHWWEALFHNEEMLAAAWLSLRVALASATLAALLGLAAGYVLARIPRFFGRALF